MLVLFIIHTLVSLYSIGEFLGTAFHEPLLSVCGHFGETTLLLFLLDNILQAVIFYLNYRVSNSIETNILKRTRLLFFFLVISSPIFLFTPFFPGIFCKFTEFSRSSLGRTLSSFSIVLLESCIAIIYFIRYDKYVIHKELYPSANLDTSLKL